MHECYSYIACILLYAFIYIMYILQAALTDECPPQLDNDHHPHYDNDMVFCAFLPLQRLRGICAHGTLSMPLGDNNVEHTVVVLNILPFNSTVL